MLAESKSRTFLRSSGFVRTLWIRAAEVRGHSSPAVGGLPHGTLDNLADHVVLRTCERSGRLALGQPMDHVRPKGEQSPFELGTRVAEVLGCSPADGDLPHLWPLPPCHPPYCLLLTALPVLSSSALLSTSSRKLCTSWDSSTSRPTRTPHVCLCGEGCQVMVSFGFWRPCNIEFL